MRAITAIFYACILAACASGNVPGQIGGGDDTTVTDAPSTTPVCGDGKCASVEIGQCTADCGMPPPAAVCGNSKCEPPTESSTNCVMDCPVSSNCNHNGVCDANESTADCADDCMPASTEVCPIVLGAPLPSSCKDCANGDGVACLILGKSQAECMMCVVEYCQGQTANGTCDFFETPITCVDCFDM